jgi:hypothetical protein
MLIFLDYFIFDQIFENIKICIGNSISKVTRVILIFKFVLETQLIEISLFFWFIHVGGIARSKWSKDRFGLKAK